MNPVQKYVVSLLNKMGGVPQIDKKTGRVFYQLKRRRQYIFETSLENLRLAIISAEEVEHPRRRNLYTLYKEAMRDLHLRSQINNAIIKVLKAPWGIMKEGSDKVDEEKTRLLEKKWFEDLSRYVLEHEFWGHSLIEFQPKVPGKDLAEEFKEVILIPREHVRPEFGEILIQPEDQRGIDYRKAPFTDWLLEAGDPYDLGLLQHFCREVFRKNYARNDWSQSSETFGDPILALGHGGADTKEIDKLEDMARNFGKNLFIIHDDLDQVKLLDRSARDTYNIWKEQAIFCNEEISKGANGQTGTTDEKSFVGSAEVHERLLNAYTATRLENLYYYHNETTIPFLIRHGYPFKGYKWQPLELLNRNKVKEPEEQEEGNPKKDSKDDIKKMAEKAILNAISNFSFPE